MSLHTRPLQNRVTPAGEIVATSARGTMMGNRGGRIHRANKTLSNRRWASRAWITCRLEFKDRHREVMSSNSYTELFFLDEATALAAGHRPCFECRRKDAVAFAHCWQLAHGSQIDSEKDGDYPETAKRQWRAKADAIDFVLHKQRLTARFERKTHKAHIGDLPDGTIIRWQGEPHLLTRQRLAQWTAGGYRPTGARPNDHKAGTARVEVLTPPAIVAVILRGYLPQLHQSAQ